MDENARAATYPQTEFSRVVGGTPDMSGGDSMLARIREALTLKADARHGVGLPTVSEHRRVLPSVGESVEEQFALFARNSVELKATFRLMSDEAQIHAEL